MRRAWLDRVLIATTLDSRSTDGSDEGHGEMVVYQTWIGKAETRWSFRRAEQFNIFRSRRWSTWAFISLGHQPAHAHCQPHSSKPHKDIFW